MRRRHPRRIALVIAIAVAMIGAQMVPAPALAGLRAMGCCANSCHKADPVGSARRCCVLKAQGAPPAALVRPVQPGPPLLARVALAAPRPAASPQRHPDSRDGILLRPGPLFLLTGSLRL